MGFGNSQIFSLMVIVAKFIISRCIDRWYVIMYLNPVNHMYIVFYRVK